MFRGKKWTPEAIEAFGKSYETDGPKATAAKYGLTVKHTYSLAGRYGFKSNPHKNNWDEGDDYLVVGLHLEGVSHKEIARKMDKTEWQISALIASLRAKGKFDDLMNRHVRSKFKWVKQ